MTYTYPIYEKLDDYEYHEVVAKGNVYEGFYNRNPHPPYPTDCDGPPYNVPEEDDLDNGLWEDYATAFIFSKVDEGLYDRNPYTGFDGFEFTWEALNPGAILSGVCVSWLLDPTLDNGTLEESVHAVFPPYDVDWVYEDGAWATASNGVYDEPGVEVGQLVSTYDAPCSGNAVWSGFDDGEYDQIDQYCECETFPQDDETECYIDPCVEEDLDCDADGGILTVYGPPNYEEDCECVVDCCLADNEEIPPPPPYLGPDVINGDIYDRYCKPQLNPPPEIELCPISPVYVELVELTQSMKLSLLPSVRNSFKPLRLWKNHTLMVTDDVPTGGVFDPHNFLVADENRGAEPENSYRHFVRLPIEYPREGREWTRAVQVCRNQSYFSAPPATSRMLYDKEDAKPIEFCESYRESDLSDKRAIYDESFIYSSITDDFEQIGSVFQDSKVEVEDPRPLPYSYGGVSDYDSLDARIPTEDGEWRGKYYMRGPNPEITGHLSTDIDSEALIELDHTMVYDESPVKRPDTTFAQELPKAKAKNYVVSYSYFVADLSASEEPVFEPTSAICWRNPLIDGDTAVDDECVFSPIESNTAYLLHPQELDYGKRTREPRTAGEITAKAETEEGFFAPTN